MILLRRKLSELAVDRSELACLIRSDIAGSSSFDSCSGLTLNHCWVLLGNEYDRVFLCRSLKARRAFCMSGCCCDRDLLYLTSFQYGVLLLYCILFEKWGVCDGFSLLKIYIQSMFLP